MAPTAEPDFLRSLLTKTVVTSWPALCLNLSLTRLSLLFFLCLESLVLIEAVERNLASTHQQGKQGCGGSLSGKTINKNLDSVHTSRSSASSDHSPANLSRFEPSASLADLRGSPGFQRYGKRMKTKQVHSPTTEIQYFLSTRNAGISAFRHGRQKEPRKQAHLARLLGLRKRK